MEDNLRRLEGLVEDLEQQLTESDERIERLYETLARVSEIATAAVHRSNEQAEMITHLRAELARGSPQQPEAPPYDLPPSYFEATGRKKSIK